MVPGRRRRSFDVPSGPAERGDGGVSARGAVYTYLGGAAPVAAGPEHAQLVGLPAKKTRDKTGQWDASTGL